MATKTVKICDDCGEEMTADKDKKMLIVFRTYDCCHSCLVGRVHWSLEKFPLGKRFRECGQCEGKGTYRDYGFHNDYTTETCETCKGEGKIDLLGENK